MSAGTATGATSTLRAFLDRLTRRRLVLAALRGVAAGLLAALPVALGVRLWADPATEVVPAAVLIALVGAVAGALIGLSRGRRATRVDPAANIVERNVASSRNVVRTAGELLDSPAAAPSGTVATVTAMAAGIVRGLDPRRLLPGRRVYALLGVTVLAWAAALALMAARPDALPALVAPGSRAEVGGIESIEVVITPPVYASAERVTLRDPDRIEALAGSRLSVTVRADVSDVALETVDGRQELDASDDGEFTGTITADADGFLSFDPVLADGRPGLRRIIGLTVAEDSVPRVRITAPAGDVRLPDGNRSIEIEIEAEDDIGLASLRLSYTKVTGFGEQFTFLEGEVPIEITRTGPRRWTARTRWPLSDLELERGDIVVYRAVATDTRPGSPAGESETYVIELAGQAAVVGGFAGEEELDRYALSQQMVVVLTERLLAGRDTLTEERFLEESQRLSAAQRTVRAEFVFMLGGMLEDEHEGADEAGLMELHEEAHARVDQEVSEGRLASQGRMDLARAIQTMSHAVTLLTAAEVEEALEAEQTALIFLQRAFSRSRYIMRALSEREQLDASRRLTGTLTDAAPGSLPAQSSQPDDRTQALREVLGEAAALAGAARLDDEAGASLAALAQSLLRVDPASAELQDIARSLTTAADAAARGREPVAREALGQAVVELGRYVRGLLPAAASGRRPAALDRLDGALTDALRAGGSP